MSRIKRERNRLCGFSMIELVTVMAITGVMTVSLANILQHPMNGYAAISRRTELVALANLTLDRMARDLRHALPNSVRVESSGQSLEFLRTSGGGRYRSLPGVNQAGSSDEEDHSDTSDWLSFGGDDSFNLIGRFPNLAFSYGSALSAGSRLAIYPTGNGIWSEAASNSNPGTITPATSSITITDDGDEDQLQLDVSHQFTFESPRSRLYIVDTPVTFLCDLADESIWRIANYAISAAQPFDRHVLPLSAGQSARTADRIESCSFSYAPGSPTRAGIISIEIVLENAEERVRLFRQVQVTNAP